jgi:hypothetical protein
MVTATKNRIGDNFTGKPLTELMLCSGCSQQIHNTAWVCPSCGQRFKAQRKYDWWSLFAFQVICLPMILALMVGALFAIGFGLSLGN